MSEQRIAQLQHQIMSVQRTIADGKAKLLREKDSLSDKDHDLIVRTLAVMDRQLEDLETELDLVERELARQKLSKKYKE